MMAADIDVVVFRRLIGGGFSDSSPSSISSAARLLEAFFLAFFGAGSGSATADVDGPASCSAAYAAEKRRNAAECRQCETWPLIACH